MGKKMLLQVGVTNHYTVDNGKRRNTYYGVDEGHKWYEFDPEEGIVEEIPSLFHVFPRQTSTTCLNSAIYVCGGTEFMYHQDMFYKPFGGLRNPPIKRNFWRLAGDTYHLDDENGIVCANSNSWITGPTLTQRRVNPHTVSVDGKIYVFGGLREVDLGPSAFAEVFDTNSNSWSVMVPPTTDDNTICVSTCCFVNLDSNLDVKKRLILVYFPTIGNGCIYSYDLDLKMWDLYDSEFGNWIPEVVVDPVLVSSVAAGGGTNPILLTLDDDLYQEDKKLLYAYDVARKMWFKDLVSGFEVPAWEPSSYGNQYKLVSSGSNGKFLLFWTRKYMENMLNLRVCVMSFTLFYEEDGLSLAVKAEYSPDFTLDMADSFISCLPQASHSCKKRGGDSPYTEDEDK